MKFRAQITVNTKPSIKDIKAQTLKQAVDNLFKIEDFKCSAGNIYWLEFSAENEVEALGTAKKIAQDILSNPVIEDYEISVSRVEAQAQ